MSERNFKAIKINLNGPFSSYTECDPYSEKACRDAADSLGLTFAAAGNYKWTKGCYTYSSGTYEGKVYYGTGGTMDQMKSLLSGSTYRPTGYDCIGSV